MGITISKTLPSEQTVTYAQALACPSLRFDTGTMELVIALYKSDTSRFAGAAITDYDRKTITLTQDERCAVLDIVYAAIAREGIYPDGVVRDPDPEKEAVTEETAAGEGTV